VNHFCNIVYFIYKLIREKKPISLSPIGDTEEDEIRRQIKIAIFYCMWPERGKMKINWQYISGGHCEVAAELFSHANIYATEEDDLEYAKKIKFAFMPVTKKNKDKFIKNLENWMIWNGPTVMIHTMNLKARYFELRKMPILQAQYKNSLTPEDQELLEF